MVVMKILQRYPKNLFHWTSLFSFSFFFFSFLGTYTATRIFFSYIVVFQLHAGIAEVAAAKARMFINKPDGSMSLCN